ncbi:MAG: ABC transporter permease [Anaerolineae bacterium]|nr:ABC transporter permease [Anaerolineae bacterium]
MSSLRAYIITRVLLTIPMVLILLVLVFVLLRVMPGDPIKATMRPGVPEEYLDQIRHAQGLDRPLLINLRGSAATVSEPVVVLYAEHDEASAPVMLVRQGQQFPVTDRSTEGGEDWLRVSIDVGEQVWVEQEKLKWLRRVEFHFKTVKDAGAPPVEGNWNLVTMLQGGLEGWGRTEAFRVHINPLDSQFFNYLWGLISRFDLGKSITLRGRPVAADLVLKFPATVELSIFGMLVATTVGVFSGAFAAQKRRSAADYGLRIYSIVAYAIPIFWLGLMFQLIFGVGLGWLPVTDRVSTQLRPETIAQVYELEQRLTGSLGQKILSITDFFSNFLIFNCLVTGQWKSLGDALKHLVLPSLTLGLYLSGVFTRLTRANMLDVLQQDFITAARARGIRERIVVYRHALLNAFIPILTMFGLQFASLLAGAVLTETTFNWPGMGLFLVNRIVDRDFPAIQGTVVFFALLVATVSLIVDIIYARIDPRVRY